jgi:uncharacterized damage-inducible protein DinB
MPYELAVLADQDRARGNLLYKLPYLRTTRPVTGADEKQALHRYLRNARAVLLWKLEGLSDYDIRRPVTPAGTNLLGLVKHCAGVERGYFGAVLGRPFPGEDDLDWHDGDDGELSGDMYATAAESREQVTDCCRRVQAHSDATIGELPPDAYGTVPWWPGERRHATLHTLLVHTIQQTARHAGHADIIRESTDGAAGLREGVSNMPAEAGAPPGSSTTTSWTGSRGPHARTRRRTSARWDGPARHDLHAEASLQPRP